MTSPLASCWPMPEIPGGVPISLASGHTEVQTVALVLAELRREHPALYGSVQTGVRYPNSLRQKCDLLISPSGGRSWAVEVKMLRLMGDNGKPNDNMLTHILSPYPSHRSALTDCQKLAASGFSGSLGVS
jgi:hypothetical protein